MVDFKLRYQAYRKAESKSSVVAQIGAVVIMLLVGVPLYWLIEGSISPSGWRVFLFLLTVVVTCVVGAVADYCLKRCFLKLFYAQGLRKVEENR